MAELDDEGMVAAFGFLDHVGPPEGHDRQQPDKTGAEDHAAELQSAEIEMFHPENEADGRYERENRAKQRPGARRHQVVVVIWLGVTVGHIHLLLAPASRDLFVQLRPGAG